ncbi:MAG TPA: hypothetical protein HA277_02660 [Methanosphaera sp.]|nr:hypothetical protein [Methanosphaera sp.]
MTRDIKSTIIINTIFIPVFRLPSNISRFRAITEKIPTMIPKIMKIEEDLILFVG